MTPILLGTGRLSWPRDERVSDRYGCVMLMQESDDDALLGAAVVDLVGTRGRLHATVISTCDSQHIGDIFRGFYPTRPEVGEVIDLGVGAVFTDRCEQYVTVGLTPDDERDSDWLDPSALYRCHSQTVNLYFTPDPA